MLNFIFAMGTSPGSQGANPFAAFMPIILIFFIFYFLIIRPQQRQRKSHEAMISGLKKGDQVVTTSGIHGIVVGIKEKTIILKVADGLKIEFQKNAVSFLKKASGTPQES